MFLFLWTIYLGSLSVSSSSRCCKNYLMNNSVIYCFRRGKLTHRSAGCGNEKGLEHVPVS